MIDYTFLWLAIQKHEQIIKNMAELEADLNKMQIEFKLLQLKIYFDNL